MAQTLAQVAGGAVPQLGSHVDSGAFSAHSSPSGAFTPQPGLQSGVPTPARGAQGFVTPHPGFGGGVSTPQPGSQGMLTPGFGIHALHAAGAGQTGNPFGTNNTNAALTATPPLPVRSSKAPWFAGGIAAVLVLGVGAVVLARSFGAGPEPEPSASAPPATEVVPKPAAQPAPPPAVEPAAPEAVAVDDLVDAADPEPLPERVSAPARARRAPSAAKSVAAAPKSAPLTPAPPPPEPVAEPPKPVVAKPIRKKPGIDVGY